METRRKQLKRAVFRTDDSWGPLILRVLLAIVIFPHGAQKLFGIFGGFGFAGTMDYFTTFVGLPYSIGLGVILLETIGVLALLLGFGARLLAVSFTILALGIMLTAHMENGFFMNWYGNQAGEGIEYFLLWMAITCSLVNTGAGRYSLDNWFYNRSLISHENYWILPGKT